jgi:hypothetical protein
MLSSDLSDLPDLPTYEKGRVFSPPICLVLDMHQVSFRSRV